MAKPSPVVAHCVTPYLEPSMVWVHDQIRCLERYRPMVLTQAVRDPEAFPVEMLHSADRRTLPERALLRLIRGGRGTYAGYGSILRREGACVIHAHFGQEGYRCLAARGKSGLPMVTTFYGLDASALPRIPAWKRRLSRLFEEGERFLAEGPHLGNTLVELGCDPGKVTVHPLGVDLDQIGFVDPVDRVEGAPTVLMYAAFREKKGHMFGIRAFSRVAEKHPETRLTLVGDGPLRPEIEAEIRRLGLAERVTLKGWQPREACIDELRRATVLLYPSVTASDGDTEGGAPVALIEAMAAGLPIVSSRHADIPFVAPENECAILRDERDEDGLAEGLDELLGSEERRREMAKAGRRHVEAQHDLRKQVRGLEEIYDGMIGG